MKKISDFLSENFLFLEVKISIYLNRRVFVMLCRHLVFHLSVCTPDVNKCSHASIQVRF